MKIVTLIAASLLTLLSLGGRAQAQTAVVESPLVLTSTILTQGTETVKKSMFGVTLTTQNIKSTPFLNRDVLTEMLKRGLITTSISGWSLVALSDDTGATAAFAKKANTPHVAVPADLLTLPTFGPPIKGGTSVTTPFGVSANGTSEIALATATIKGIPVSGLATNGKHTITIKRDSINTTIDTLTTAMTFDGGIDGTPSPQLVKGVLVVGSAKGLPSLTSLPLPH